MYEPRSPSPPPRPAYSALPDGLGFLDRRPRDNLLGDIEFVLGRKLTFPFLDKLQKRKKREVVREHVEEVVQEPKEITFDQWMALGQRRVRREGNWI